ncbi:MAG TPA: c-type cytochrome [Acidobacteriota bacterium]|nr:c-type cytochrome [Acidobacteriota bacterium]
MKIKTPIAILLAAFVLTLPTTALGWMAFSEIDLPDDPLRGRELFESKSCIRCHGLAGRGASIGPSLGHGRFQGSFLDLGASLWNHVPGMSVSFERNRLAWPRLNEKETTELFAFLYFIDYLGRPGQPARGRKVFQERKCSSCHVIGGGRLGSAPDLLELKRFASPLYVAQEIWNHGPAMIESMRQRNIAPPAFGPGDLADLSAFIRQQSAPGPRTPLLSAPGNPNRGSGRFNDMGCAKCHGSDARGGAGPDLSSLPRRSAESIAGAMLNHLLDMREAMSARGIEWPLSQGSDLADLTAFLYFLPFAEPPGNPQRGAQVFSRRMCADCHQPSAAAQEFEAKGPAAVAPDLSQSPAADSPAALVSALWSHSPIMREAILGQGRPWPELTGKDLRDLRAYLAEAKGEMNARSR